ncbi:60S ribosomal protein L4 [Myotis davidii]|uniref:60S ribosomal protein L4 n=1 Tax=Myotis davidii TaxID=225400 RepID=L5LXE5_MYODS|nr:60S ribosomal protein L4 [Myotis davidii]
MRAGEGKMTNRGPIQLRGPHLIYNEDNGAIKVFSNIPRITLLNAAVNRDPFGSGHFCIWAETASRKLDELYGTWRRAASLKSSSNLPTPKMLNTNLSRILKSPEIQRAL